MQWHPQGTHCWCHHTVLGTDLQRGKSQHHRTCLLHAVSSTRKRKASLPVTVPLSPRSSPLFSLQQSPSAFSLPREDSLKTPSLETASRPPKGQGQPPREEAALSSWRSTDRLDETSNGFKRHLVGLWVLGVPLGGCFPVSYSSLPQPELVWPI